MSGKRLFCMVFNAFFFLEDRGTPAGCRSSNDSVFACAHGDCECLRLDACAGFMERMELALWNCEWMTWKGGGCCAREVLSVAWGEGGICCLTENECKQNPFCLCCLSLLTVEGSRGVVWRSSCVGERPLCGRRWNYSSLLKIGRSFCLVQLLNVQCIT